MWTLVGGYRFSDDHRDCGSAFLKGKMSPDRGTGSSSGHIAGSDSPVFPGRDYGPPLVDGIGRPQNGIHLSFSVIYF